MSSHRRAVWVSAAIVAALLIFGVVWFQPQKLVIDEAVNEALPSAQAGAGDGSSGDKQTDRAPRASEKPETLAAGKFRSLEHDTVGRALVLQVSDGKSFLRLQDLQTSNGPDLRVYLSEIPASDDWYAYGERFIDLGALKGNVGDQNYALPADLDLARYKSAVIWCRRFTVGFGVAPLEPV